MSLKSCGWSRSFPSIPIFLPHRKRSSRRGEGGGTTMLLAYAQLSLRAFTAIFAPLFGHRGWRLSALFDQMVNIGVASMPTVALANFLLGIVLAIQGAGQFAKLGATDLVANLVAFSILREIGPLIT